MSEEGQEENTQYDPVEYLRQGRELFFSKTDDVVTPPEENARGRILIVVLALIILVAVTLSIYGLTQYQKSSQLHQAAEEQAIASIAAKYNALTEWNANLEKLDTIYLSDVQEALVRTGRSILINVMVVDVGNMDDKYVVKFKKLEADDPQILFILECNAEQAKRILEDRDKDSDFSAIALISSVRRATSEDIGKEVGDTETFIANGHCLDLMLKKY
jgi:hypothetical protein